MRILFALVLSAAHSFSTFAATEDIFVVKKSFSPHNVIHYEAHIENCKLVHPFISAYWIMGEKGGKVAKLNFIQKKFLSPVVIESSEQEVEFTLNALNDFDIPGSDKNFKATLSNCHPISSVSLDGQIIEVSEIYADGKLGLFGMDVNFITLTGKYPDGTKLLRKINNN